MKSFKDNPLVSVFLTVSFLALIPQTGYPQMNRWSVIGLDEKTVSALLVDPENENTLYAGTRDGGGMFKTRDGGAHWTELKPMRRVQNILALEIDPKDTRTLYAGTSSGVLRSDDGGENWKVVNSGLPTPTINALEIDPRTPSTLYAGTWGDGVFKSTDKGESWSAANVGLSGAFLFALEIDPKDTRTLYAGTGKGLFRSTDAGAKWSRLGPETDDSVVQAITVSPRDPSQVLIAANSWVPGSGYAGRILKSADRGENWRDLGTGLPEGRIYTLGIGSPDAKQLYCGTENGVFKSADGGANWKALKTGLPNAVVRSIAIDRGSGALYAGASGGALAMKTGP